MLGVIIGVGAVIAMVAIGQGAHASIRAKIASLGANSLIILPGSTTQSGVRYGWGGWTADRHRSKKNRHLALSRHLPERGLPREPRVE